MKTILFIEDNEDIRENMGEILELAGYEVLLAPNGREGVETALARRPDLIICDIMMPELDGYGVIHLLQKHPETRRIPFIFLTAKAERAELRKGMELGADDYITKPFSGTELLNAVEGRLKKAELQGAAQDASPLPERQQDLEQLFAAAQDTHAYRKKQPVYSEGQQPYRLYRVESGKVKIFRTNEDGKDLITEICQAGDFFGYTALLEGAAYGENAEALEDAEIGSITRDAFEKLIRQNSGEARELIRMLAGHVRAREEQLLRLAYNSLRKKVAETLLLLQQKYQSGSGSPAPISISRENLAAAAGTAKESLIRTLSDFREEGLIGIRGTDIMILDRQKLERLLN